MCATFVHKVQLSVVVIFGKITGLGEEELIECLMTPKMDEAEPTGVFYNDAFVSSQRE